MKRSLLHRVSSYAMPATYLIGKTYLSLQTGDTGTPDFVIGGHGLDLGVGPASLSETGFGVYLARSVRRRKSVSTKCETAKKRI